MRRRRGGVESTAHQTDTVAVAASTQVITDHGTAADPLRCCVSPQEWCQFSHQFRQRSGGDSEFSPIFIQAMDATWQLLRQ